MAETSDVEDIKLRREKALESSSKAMFEALNLGETSKETLASGSESRVGSKEDENKHIAKVIKKLFRRKSGKPVKESDMKKLNQRFLDGHLPRLKESDLHDVDNNSDSDDEDSKEKRKNIQHEGYLKMSIRFSIKSFQFISKYAQKSVSKAGRNWMLTLLPTGQISTLVSFLLFSYVMKASFLSWFVPLAVLFISICVMLVSSVRLIRGVKRFEEFKAWAEFLDSVSTTQQEAIDTNHAEVNYIAKHMSPYIHFMISSAFCVMAYGTSDKSWVLNAELGILSVIFYGLIIYIYSFYKNKSSLAIFVCQILGTILGGFQCTDKTDVIGYITSLNVPFLGIAVNISISSILRIFVLFKVVEMCITGFRQGKIMGVHMGKVVLPHIVAITWWDIADMFLCYSSATSVTRAAAEFFALFFAMPAFTLFLIFGAIKLLLSMDILKIAVTAVLIAVPTLYFKAWKNKKEYLGRAGRLLENKTVKSVLMVFGFVTLAFIMLSYRPSGLKVPKSNLSWDEYKKICLDNEEASAIVSCQEFKGYEVTWAGVIDKVNVVDIDNKVNNFLNLMPHSIANWMSCIYGNQYPNPEECSTTNNLTALEKSLCTISPSTRRPCHLQKYNVYKFKIAVKMPSEYNINLDISHDFNQLVLSLKQGTHLRFTGAIESRNTLSTKVLYIISKDDGMKGIEQRHARIEKTLGRMLDESLDSLYNFLLYPIISFTDDDNENDA